MKNKLVKPSTNFINVVYSLAGKAISVVALVILDIVEARLLGKNQYAEWAFFFSVINICFFVGWAGVNASSKVIISHRIDPYERLQCLTASLIIRVVIAIAVAVLSMLILFFLAPFLGYPDKYPDLRVLFLFSGMLILLNAFADYYKNIFVGLGNFKYVFVITVSEYVLYLVICTFFLILLGSIKAVVYGYVIAGGIVAVVGLFLIRHDYNVFTECDKKMIITNLKCIAQYAVPMFVVGIGAAILIELDTFMLGILSTKSEVAVYSIAKNLTNKFAHVNLSIATGVMTTFAVIHDKDKEEKIRKFNVYSFYNFVIALFFAVIIFTFSPFFVNYLYGEEYVRSAYIFRALSLFHMINAISIFYATFLDFRGRATIRSIAYVGVIVFDILLNCLLIPHYGAIGATIATEISMFPYMVVTVLFSYKEIRKIKKEGDDFYGKKRMEKADI